MPDPTPNPNPAPPADPAAPDLAKENAALKAELEKLKATPSPTPPPNDPTLLEKARLDRENKDKGASDLKALESAMRFNMSSSQWLKDNQGYLPKEISDIFDVANKEKFDSEVEKASAIKVGVVESFFKQQSNLDLLTPGLKSKLDDWLKLTKNGKQERAQEVWDSIFEPGFELLRRVKKADALNKGHGDGSDDAYKTKMIKLSQKHYGIGDKNA